jgi:cell division protein FtsI (penicillin-binding protein 3)
VRTARPANHERRLRLSLVVLLVVLIVFSGRLFQLQGIDATTLAAKALASRSTTHPLPAERGDILDTNGAKLATTVERRNVTVDQTLVPAFRQDDTTAPPTSRGVAGAATALAPVLGMSVPDLVTALTGAKRFAYVIKDVEPQVWRDAQALKIPGLFSESASRRTYPGGTVAASLIGFVGKDGTPLAGIERAQNRLLKGKAGTLTYEQGAGGQQIATGLTTQTDPVPGGDVQLTIDRDLQWKTQQALGAAVTATKSEAGEAVVMTRDGDILAMADAPTFDANSPGTAKTADLSTRSLVDVFEPGSTSKVITAAAALEEKKVKPTSRITVPGVLHRGGKWFHDSHAHGTEKLTFAGVLAKSSNIGTIKVGERMAPATMYDYLTKFGIGQPTTVGLPESRGILAPAPDWSRSQRYTVLFGQGLSVTALQSAGVFATIANDGVRVVPRLIKARPGPDGRLQPQPPGAKTRVVSVETARQLRLMLESVVGDDGTAVQATIPGYRVAGKTGTAQRFDDSCHCYRGYTASFVGMAPADDPQLVVAVFLQNPIKGYFGGIVAAPVFQQVMTYALAARGVAPSGTKAPQVPLEWP